MALREIGTATLFEDTETGEVGYLDDDTYGARGDRRRERRQRDRDGDGIADRLQRGRDRDNDGIADRLQRGRDRDGDGVSDRLERRAQRLGIDDDDPMLQGREKKGGGKMPKTAYSGTDTASGAGDRTITIEVVDAFEPTDITFEGSSASGISGVKSVKIGRNPVWDSTNPVPLPLFSPTSLLRGVMEQSGVLKANTKVYITVTYTGPATCVATLVGNDHGRAAGACSR